MTIAELLIASSILVLCLVSLSGVLGSAISSSTMTRARDEATNIANDALETARNLPYDSVGLLYADGSLGNPPGKILTPRQSGKYTIATTCTWVSAADGSTAYKQLKVTVSWTSPMSGQVTANTLVYGKTALSGVGDLVVQLSDRESPSPVAGREITFHAANGTTRLVTTDASGQALFGQVPVGPFTLSLLPPSGYIVDTTALTGATVSVDSASTVILYIQRPAKATVSVLDVDGAPLSGTLVSVKRSDWAAGITAYTDANGVAVFSNVLYGDYAATVTRTDYAAATLPFSATPAASSPSVAFSMSPSHDHGVRAKVQDSNGTQIVGATVVLATQAGVTLSQGVTGSNGEVLFTPVAVGTYSVAVSMPGYAGSSQAATVHWDHDQETLTFRLSAQGSMHILTTKGNTPTDCTLIVSCPSPYYYSNTLATGSGANAVGELLLQGLLPGSYSVKKAGSSGSGTTVVVTIGQTSSVTLKN